MKTKIFLTAAFFFLLFSQTFSQGVKQGNIGFDLGIGFGIYGANNNDVNDSVDNGVNAACSLIPFNFSYALSNNFSAGLDFERNGFLNNDSTFAHSLNFGISGTYRFVNKEKCLFSFAGIVNVSSLTFGDVYSDRRINGNGFNLQIIFTYSRFYGKHFGYFINTAYTFYKYTELYDEDGNYIKVNNGSVKYELSLFGANIRTGVCFKF